MLYYMLNIYIMLCAFVLFVKMIKAAFISKLKWNSLDIKHKKITYRRLNLKWRFFQDLKPFFNISKPSDDTKMPLCSIFLKTNRHIFQRKKKKKKYSKKESFKKNNSYLLRFENATITSFLSKNNGKSPFPRKWIQTNLKINDS